MITYAFDQLIQAGIERIIVNTHHCAEKYQEVFPDNVYRSIPLVFRHEPDLLETGGGIKNIEDLLNPDAPLLVYNGDVLSTLPLQPLIQHHCKMKCEASLGLRSKDQPRRVFCDTNGWVQDMRSTRFPDSPGNTLFTGIYLIEYSFLRRLTHGKKESVVPTFLKMIEEGTPPSGLIINEGLWIDVGTVEIYEELKDLSEHELLQHR